MIYWLISRQTTIFDEEDDYEDDTETSAAGHDAHSLEFTTAKELQWIGFNGRCNKVADTCYSWWVIGSLDVSVFLHHPTLLQSTLLILRSSTIFILQSFNYSFSEVPARAAQLKFLHAPLDPQFLNPI